MKLSYIFDRKPIKEKNSIRINTSFIPYLPDSFKKNADNIIYKINEEEYNLSYVEKVLYGENGSIFHVSFEYIGETEQAVIVLEHINSSLNCKSIKESFNKILVTDSVSEYYCNLGYPIVNNFERTMRELIYIILTKALGYEWAYNLLEDEQKNRIKKNLGNSSLYSKKLENALYGMDFGMMINFLFIPYRRKIQETVKLETLEKYSKEQLIEYIKDTQLDSIWNLYFSEYKIENIEESLKKIQNYRNIIAHSKIFTKIEFNDLKDTINSLINPIELAINLEIFKTFNINDLKYSMQKMQRIIEEIIRPEFNMENFLLKMDELKKVIVLDKIEKTTEDMNELYFNISKVISKRDV